LSGVSGEVSDAVALIASELASNSVRHAASTFNVRVEQLPHQIHIEVEDNGDGEPAIRSPGLADTSGRGLRIVQALADEWGVVPKAHTPGKTVWVRIALPVVDDRERAGRAQVTDPGRESDEAASRRKSGSSGPKATLLPVTGDRDAADSRSRHCRWTGRAGAEIRRPRRRCSRRQAPATARRQPPAHARAMAAKAAAPARHVRSRSDPGG
jgi:hypothetical protein